MLVAPSRKRFRRYHSAADRLFFSVATTGFFFIFGKSLKCPKHFWPLGLIYPVLPPVTIWCGAATQYNAKRTAQHKFYNFANLKPTNIASSPIPSIRKSQRPSLFPKYPGILTAIHPFCSTRGTPKKRRMQNGYAQHRQGRLDKRNAVVGGLGDTAGDALYDYKQCDNVGHT